MNLSFLIQYLKSNSNWKRLERDISNLATARVTVPDAAKPLLVYSIYKEFNYPILLITPDVESEKVLGSEMQNQFSELGSLYYFPELAEGSDSEKDPGVRSERARVLSNLYSFQSRKSSIKNVPIIIASSRAVIGKIIGKFSYGQNIQILNSGMELPPAIILQKWQSLGYELEDLVELPGHMARRGGILDIFPFDSEYPLRIELEGNQVVSIREFNPKTQRSVKDIQSVTINSAREQIDDLSGTIFDYFPENSIVVLDKFEEIVAEFDVEEQIENDKNTVLKNEFVANVNKIGRRVYLEEWDLTTNADKSKSSFFLNAPKYGGRLEQFIKDLAVFISEGSPVLIVSQQADRLEEMLNQKNIAVSRMSGEAKQSISEYKGVMLEKGAINEGWMIKGTLMVLGDNEIFGWLKQQRSYKKRAIRHHILLNQLVEGDYVVHVDHGIGKFTGLVKLANNGPENEYMMLEYASGDKLYVPVDQIDRVGRYIGGSDQAPSLSRLNTQEWSQTKARIKKSVQDIAEELLKVQAARELAEGFAFSGDNIWQQEMESSFPYVETPDQLEAIKNVKRDMEQCKPMDRLICGDVGYGKTEIALRAAFKAVMDNKQVAMLVPTTVLAQQHFLTFRERLQAFPIKLAVLSRFYSDKEQKEVIEGLARGTVDICIGTHRLLQKDVSFKDMGLLIIDEEQRFGVVHKEYLKKLRKEVDVLTLSATPIPRTLNMALSSIKDLSTLETPPEERLPIQTFVGPLNKSQIREAVMREIRRGGQIFYVHNRVQNIHGTAHELKELVPEARISVAHGQMDEVELEKVMSEFVSHDVDILLTTTIIESGIDIPRANTLIIDDSDRLGLTQLYQLRGRIGRGSNNAFAYLFFNRHKQLKEQAKKRLKTIEEATELGSGFAIAMKDLEIRGAGNILGSEQSGYIAAVGFDLYCRLLEDAVGELRSKLKGRPEENQRRTFSNDVTISLGLKAFIPESYVQDEKVRIDFYRRLAGADIKELKDVREEFLDRFGEIPEELKNLFYIIEIKRLASILKIESMSKKDEVINIVFTGTEGLNQNPRIRMIENKYKQFVSIGNSQLKLDVLGIRGGNWQQLLKDMLLYLGEK